LARPIAHSGEPVPLANGDFSSEYFHSLPDAAAVFETGGGAYRYVSNAENDKNGSTWQDGGVGAIDFDSNGHVIGYQKIASGTQHNCGGGKTPWNSWVSGEERDNGRAVQIDPQGIRAPVVTAIGDLGNYESFAYDDRTTIPTFYMTMDDAKGVVTRLTPDNAAYTCYLQSTDYDRWCTLESGTLDYLLLTPGGLAGWTAYVSEAAENAKENFPSNEGINIKDGIMYITSKTIKRLVIVNLVTLEYSLESTEHGAFVEEPDQIVRIPGDDSGRLFFCEDGGLSPGLHVRNSAGLFITILHRDGTKFNADEETTGLAFSPDAQHLYVAFQDKGIVYDVTRDDGCSFRDEYLSGDDDSPPRIDTSNGMRVCGMFGVVSSFITAVVGMSLA
jgi:hypothetical protein